MSKFRTGESTHADRLARKAQAAERTAWNTYRVTDTKAIYTRLEKQHAAKRLAAAAAGLPLPTDSDLAMAYVVNLKRLGCARGFGSCYSPHQGTRECARRVRQGINYG